MSIIERINSSDDIKKLSESELDALCAEIREFLIKNVAQTGGHLASNLGTVELTVALHRVYDTSVDRIVFDVGHQSYTHKIITGRRDDFPTLRQHGGLSGFPKPYECADDAFVTGHASTSVSVATGMARARALTGDKYDVAAVIGDGAMTGGLAYEGLEDAAACGEPIVIILNDNNMSISENVGGMSRLLAAMRYKPAYISFKRWYRAEFKKLPALYRFNHRVKEWFKSWLLPDNTFSQCRQSSDASNIARYAALKAGIPERAPGNTVMCACASGMLAVREGMDSVLLGQNKTVLVGGVESMTNAIYYLSNVRWGLKAGSTELKDSLTEAQFCSQPADIYGRFNMGMTAENIAEKYGITRTEQDEFALHSQEKAAKAIAEGRFKDEIIPLTVPQGKKQPDLIFDTDEFPRQTSMEALAKLKPAFKPDGSVTAGNASGRNDGASALILTTESHAKELGLAPLARIKAIANAGVDPKYMGLGPVAAVERIMAQTGYTLGDIQLIELNEAFASQSIACIRQLNLEDRMDIINVNGGAIALGHPIGSSGSRIIVTLLHEMRKRKLDLGLATLCVAGGMGMAAIIETV